MTKQDNARRKILARRAAFVAAALASMSTACEKNKEPQVCLSSLHNDAVQPAGDASPQPCLKLAEDDAMPPEKDESPHPSLATPLDADIQAPPPITPPRPTVCLSPLMPRGFQ